MKKNLLLLVMIIQFTGLFLHPLTAGEPVKILFLGSSYFNFNNLPGLFANLARNSEHELVIDARMNNGLSLADHASSSLSSEIIHLNKWDYVILQGAGSRVAYPDIITKEALKPAIYTLKELILENSPDTKIIFCMPWAFEDGMSWKEGWSDTYVDMQEKIDSVTREYAEELKLIVAPVGRAWHRVLEEKDFPLHYLHQSDWNHPTMKGSYLMACVLYTTIFRERTEGNPYRAGLNEKEARYFQRTSSQTVFRYR